MSHRYYLLALALVSWWFVHPAPAQAASLYFSPSSKSITVGGTVSINVNLSAGGQAINAAEGAVVFSTNHLRLTSVSRSGSIFTFWPVSPSGNNSTGRVVFSAGLPSPGYNGSAGRVITLVFQATSDGQANLSISGAKILANDGQGTDILSSVGTGAVTITAATKPKPAPPPPEIPNRPTPAVTSSTHSDQTAWYREADAKLVWTKPTGLVGVSYEVTGDQATIPDDQVDTTNTSTTAILPGDGTWYFHLRGKYDSGWSATWHFALHIDRTPPETFTPTVIQDRGLSDPTPMLTFSTTDKMSGLARYTYVVDNGQAVDATSPTDISGVKAGDHTVIVTAHDQAGNIREETTHFSITGYTAPTIISVSTPLLMLDPLVVHGIANLGDTITIYVDGRVVGQVVAGPSDVSAVPGVTVRVPWSFTTDVLFRPGTFNVTATATSPDGQVSAATDPQPVRVTGQAISINGRPIATWSVVTPVAGLFLLLLVAIIAVFFRLALAVWIMHRRVDQAEEEIEALREVNQQQSINRQQLDAALIQIEDDLDAAPTKRRMMAKRRLKKRKS